LHEKLLEMNDGLDGRPAKFLGGSALACNSVDLHCDVDHHLQVVNTVLQDLTKALFEDWVADVFVFKHVAQDEQQWLHIQVLHVA
jgi:hypothetical protein